ncbi:MAG: chemotaxis protein CheW [Spirochaetes bacterium]|nr:chemotaxis protein CheW [Spirochaetota bacterium]
MEINLKEIRESFITTTHDLLQRSEAIALEMERATSAEHFTELLRAIHTLKGNAGIFELDQVIRLCHAFETYLENLRQSGVALTSNQIDVALTVIDRLGRLVAVMDDREQAAKIGIEDTLTLMAGKSSTVAPAAHASAGSFDKLRANTKKIKLPEKYLADAQGKNRYLIFIVFDLGDQGDLTIQELHRQLLPLHKVGELLSLGVLRRESDTSNPAGPFLPYFLVLSSTERAEALIARLGLKVLLFHYFWEPTMATVEMPDKERSAIHVKETHLKVHLELLNSLIDITGEIVLTRNALVRRVDVQHDQALAAFTKKLSYLVTDLQDKVMKTRLQALDVLFHRFPRLIRETAQQTQKQAELFIEGGDIEIDKAIIDEIADPLVHILRNAVDHGLESSTERLALGKSAKGSVYLRARSREGNIVITVADDGKGLDLDHIRKTAIAKGLIAREKAAAATPAEIADYLFLPGLSTKSEVTTISGRGVGMDVVRTNISKLGGSVEITGEQGKGSTVVIVIPQTLSILTCLHVDISGFRCVIPRQNIVEVVTIDAGRLKNIQNKEVYELRERLLPLVDTGELLELKDEEKTASYIVVVRTEKYHFGLKIHAVFDTEEVVVKSIPQYGQDRQVFSGAAIMGDGQVAPILDAALIGKQAQLQSNAVEKLEMRKVKEIGASLQYLLFRIYDRKFAFRMVSQPRIESIAPDKIETVVDRQVVHYRNEVIPILSMAFVQTASTDAPPLTNLIILQGDGRRYGLLASEILDILTDTLALRREKTDRAEIEGYAILEEDTVIVLNIEELMRVTRGEAASLPTGGAA